MVKKAKAARWGKRFWSNWAERVGSVFTYGAITLLVTVNVGDLTVEQAWPIVGLPTVLAALKGLAANFKDGRSGPSLLNAPPEGEGSVVEEDGRYDKGGDLPAGGGVRVNETGQGEDVTASPSRMREAEDPGIPPH